jgi:hypothetical protein
MLTAFAAVCPDSGLEEKLAARAGGNEAAALPEGSRLSIGHQVVI